MSARLPKTKSPKHLRPAAVLLLAAALAVLAPPGAGAQNGSERLLMEALADSVLEGDTLTIRLTWVGFELTEPVPITVDTGEVDQFSRDPYRRASYVVTFAPGDLVREIVMATIDDMVVRTGRSIRALVSALPRSDGGTDAVEVAVDVPIVERDVHPVNGGNELLLMESLAGSVDEGGAVTIRLTWVGFELTEPVSFILYTVERTDDGHGGRNDLQHTVRFAPGELVRDVTVMTEDVDEIVYDEKHLFAAVDAIPDQNGGTYDVDAFILIPIVDNDHAPASFAVERLRIEALDDTVDEGGAVTIRLTWLGFELTEPVVLTLYTFERRDAGSGATTNELEHDVQFAPDELVQDFTVWTNDVDEIVKEKHLLAGVNQIPNQNGGTDPEDVAIQVPIVDNDTPVVSIAAASDSVVEGSPARFTLTRAGDVTAELSVNLSVVTATGSVTTAPHSAVLAAGSATATLAVATADDLADAADGAVAAALTVGDGYVIGTPNRATVTVEDDDPGPILDLAHVSAAESGAAVELEVAPSFRGYRSARPFTVDYATADGATADGSATAGADYTALSGTLTFTPDADNDGQPAPQTIRVPLLADADDEPDETFTLTLSNPRHATLAGGGATLAATATIEDDDLPAVSISADAPQVAEGGRAAFTLTRHGDTSVRLVVTVDVAVTDRSRVRESQRILAFEPGETAIGLEVGTLQDLQDEEDLGAVAAEIAAGDHYRAGDPAGQTVTVTDDDPPPRLRMEPVTAAESAGGLDFEVALEFVGPFDSTVLEVTVDYATAAGTAQDGDGEDRDFTPASGTLTFTSAVDNDWRPAPRTIHVPIADDELHERDETFTVTLSNARHATLPGDRDTLAATGTITNDDLPLVYLEPLSPEQIVDGEPIRWRLRRVGDTTDPLVTFVDRLVYLKDFRPAHDDARGPSQGTTHTIPAGAATLEVEFATDATWVGPLGAQFVQILLPGEPYRDVVTPPPDPYLPPYGHDEQVVTIHPALPTVTIAAATPAVTEGEDAEFTLHRYSHADSGYLDSELPVYVTWSGHTTTNAIATFPAGDTTTTIRFATSDRPFVNPDGTADARLRPTSQLVGQEDTYRLLPGRDSAEVTVRNDDLPVLIIAADAADVNEGEAASFTVTRSGDSGALTVNVAVTETGRVLAGPPPAQVTFAAGQLAGGLTLATDDDDHNEAASVITAQITAGAGYEIGAAASATATVADDDSRQIVYFDLSKTNQSVSEGQEVIFYLERLSLYTTTAGTLTLTQREKRGRLQVNLQVYEHPEWAQSASGTLPDSVTFPANQSSVKLRIPTADDAIPERKGLIVATILAGEHYRRGDENGAYPLTNGTYPRSDDVYVADDDGDPANVTLTANAEEVDEGDPITFTLTRDGGDLDRDLEVRLDISQVERGRPGYNLYVPNLNRSPFQPGVVPAGDEMRVTIAAGDTTATWTWETDDDEVNEGHAGVNVRVPRGDEYTTPDYEGAFVVVRDDDIPTVSLTDFTTGPIVEGEALEWTYRRDSSRYNPGGDTTNYLVITTNRGITGRYLPPLSDRGGTSRSDGAEILAGNSELHVTFPTSNAVVGPLGGWFELTLAPSGCSRDIITLSPPRSYCKGQQYEIGESDHMRVEIYNNSVAVYVEADTASVAEGEPARFTITRTGGSAIAWTKRLPLQIVVSQNGEFILGEAPATVDFPGGALDQHPRQTTLALEIPTLDDAIDEADGAITVQLLPTECPGCLDPDDLIEYDYVLVDDSGAGGADHSRATITVRDDDDAPRIRIADAAADEDDGAMAFDVTLDRSSAHEVTVQWATADGPGPAADGKGYAAAAAGSDYQAASGTLSFAPGAGAQTLSVTLVDDEVDESLERFTVNLSHPGNAALDDAAAIGRIADDDGKRWPPSWRSRNRSRKGSRPRSWSVASARIRIRRSGCWCGFTWMATASRWRCRSIPARPARHTRAKRRRMRRTRTAPWKAASKSASSMPRRTRLRHRDGAQLGPADESGLDARGGVSSRGPGAAVHLHRA